MSVLRWMRDRSIATKVLAAVFVGLAAFVVVGVSSALSLRSVDGRATSLYRNGVVPLGVLADVRDMEGDMRQEARDYAATTSSGQHDELRDQIKETDAQLDADVASYLKQGKQTLGKRATLMAEFKTALAKYRSVRQSDVLAAADKANTTDALSAIQGSLASADDALAQPMDDLFAAETKADWAQEDAARSTYQRDLILLMVLMVAGVVGATILGIAVARGVSRPITEVMRVLEQLGSGDLSGRVDIRSRDEAGRMGHALNAALDTLRRTVGTLAEKASAVRLSSEEIDGVAVSMASTAEQTSSQATLVAAATEQISRNAQAVASGAEELGGSIREIARSATDAAGVAAQAVGQAGGAATSIQRLSSSSAQVESVIELIGSIADQTKLLALNATIEAARAGEAGRGFEVVANEVKNLAEETARASVQVAERIRSIQADSTEAAAAVDDVAAVVDRINDYAASIAASVEEQTATTSEIARAISEVAAGSGDIAHNVAGLAQAAAGTTTAVGDSRLASQELAGLSMELTALVGQFRVE